MTTRQGHLAQHVAVSQQPRDGLACFGLGKLERAAQGALAYALTHEPAVQALVLRALGTPRSQIQSVDWETVDDEQGWRPDLTLTLRGGSTKRLELKIEAPLTPAQRRARIDLLIVPRARAKAGGDTPTLTWARLANTKTGALLRRLFREADRSRWILPRLGKRDAVRSIGPAPFAGGPLHRFLCTVDLIAAERGGGVYQGGAWNVSPRKYVGFVATARTARGRASSLSRGAWVGVAWVGNHLVAGIWEPARGGRWLESPSVPLRFPLRAEDMASAVLDALGLDDPRTPAR